MTAGFRTISFAIAVILSCLKSGVAQSSPQYEFRAVWIATVVNIDWPSKKGLPADIQRAEFTKILDLHHRNGMNAVVMQIRPATDAFYPSKLEPWSEYLSGVQGLPPSPYYDPLQFMIEEAHKRGMEFHAWLNPYRAVFNVSTSSVAPTHITRLFPNWFLTYGSIRLFNPGLPEVWNYFSNVVKDIVERYDVDGIHFDDYFYPYKIAGKELPDEITYRKYGNGLSKDDWRRSNVDSVIKLIHETIAKVNPRVKFGIAPFGVWRNKSRDFNGSDTRAGVTNYDELYADVRLWLQNGWIDYVAPQLYWEIGHRLCDYNTLVDWWGDNAFGRQVFVGHGIYRATEGKSPGWKRRSEIPDQIKSLRQNPNIQGSIYYSSKIFNANPNGWNDSLRNNYYHYPALVPPMRWIDSIPPLKPLIENLKGNRQVRILYRGAEPLKGFALYSIKPGTPDLIQYATLEKIYVADKFLDIDVSDLPIPKIEKIFIASIDRGNNVSDWVQLR